MFRGVLHSHHPDQSNNVVAKSGHRILDPGYYHPLALVVVAACQFPWPPPTNQSWPEQFLLSPIRDDANDKRDPQRICLVPEWVLPLINDVATKDSRIEEDSNVAVNENRVALFVDSTMVGMVDHSPSQMLNKENMTK